MDKNILEQYIDACALVKETEEDIKKLNKRKEITQDSVKGSNPEFPFQPQNFHIEGTREEVADRISLSYEQKLLDERMVNAKRIKLDVDAWMNTIPVRMQRIIRYKVFEGMTWEQVAMKIGRKATGEGVRMEFQRFLEKN